jgi:diguanylate cyclase (GGDEF)-like protein
MEMPLNHSPPVILAVDDKVENLDILTELLTDYDVRDVTDAASALRILTNTAVDLILLDILMPGVDGFEFCHQLQEDERTRAIPIIFISAMSDEEAISRAFAVGGKDYVTKPFRPLELLARVRTHLELKFLMERLHHLAYFDTLTDVPNRRLFFDVASVLFDEAEDLQAVMLDVDHFKQINDRYGHGVGDKVLQRVASTIAARLLPEAVFGRLGGEEFAILIPSGDPDSVLRDVDAIRQAVADLSVPLDGGSLSCTISCGLATRTTDTRTIDELLHTADQALYQAKGSGRNRVIFRYIHK